MVHTATQSPLSTELLGLGLAPSGDTFGPAAPVPWNAAGASRSMQTPDIAACLGMGMSIGDELHYIENMMAPPTPALGADLSSSQSQVVFPFKHHYPLPSPILPHTHSYSESSYPSYAGTGTTGYIYPPIPTTSPWNTALPHIHLPSVPKLGPAPKSRKLPRTKHLRRTISQPTGLSASTLGSSAYPYPAPANRGQTDRSNKRRASVVPTGTLYSHDLSAIAPRSAHTAFFSTPDQALQRPFGHSELNNIDMAPRTHRNQPVSIPIAPQVINWQSEESRVLPPKTSEVGVADILGLGIYGNGLDLDATAEAPGRSTWEGVVPSIKEEDEGETKGLGAEWHQSGGSTSEAATLAIPKDQCPLEVHGLLTPPRTARVSQESTLAHLTPSHQNYFAPGYDDGGKWSHSSYASMHFPQSSPVRMTITPGTAFPNLAPSPSIPDVDLDCDRDHDHDLDLDYDQDHNQDYEHERSSELPADSSKYLSSDTDPEADVRVEVVVDDDELVDIDNHDETDLDFGLTLDEPSGEDDSDYVQAEGSNTHHVSKRISNGKRKQEEAEVIMQNGKVRFCFMFARGMDRVDTNDAAQDQVPRLRRDVYAVE